MDRRHFLKNTGSAAVAAGTLGATAASADPGAGWQPPSTGTTNAAVPSGPHIGSGVREISMAVSSPDNGRGLGENARRLARRIQELTEGRYRIEIVPGENASSAALIHGSPSAALNSEPAFAYFSGLPGRAGVAAGDLDAWMTIGGGQLLWDQLAAAHGYKPFLAGHTGSRPALWSKQPLSADGGLQGLHFAAHGLASDVARGLGAHPVTLEAADFAQAIAEDRASAIEGPGAMYSLAAGLPQVASFACCSGINRNGSAQNLTVKLDLWDKMPSADQRAFAHAAAEEYRLSYAETRVHETLAWRVMSNRHGVVVSHAPAALVDAIDRVADAVVAHVAGSGRTAHRINASFMAFKAMLPHDTDTEATV